MTDNSSDGLHPLLGPISSRLHQLESQVARLSLGANGAVANDEDDVAGNQFVLVLLDSAVVSRVLFMMCGL